MPVDAGPDALPPDDSSCTVTSIEKLPTNYENFVVHPASGLMVVSQPDANGIYQIYSGIGEANLRCITCTAITGGPRVDRHKMMLNIHPSGQWITMGIEEDNHDLWWLPVSWQLGLMQSGVWLNVPAGRVIAFDRVATRSVEWLANWLGLSSAHPHFMANGQDLRTVRSGSPRLVLVSDDHSPAHPPRRTDGAGPRSTSLAIVR